MDILKVLQEKLGEEVFTEDFKQELESQIEVLVNEKVQEKSSKVIEEKVKEIEQEKEQFLESMKVDAEEYKNELIESVDGYLDYAVKEFFTENKIAIENEFSVKAAKELVEKFAEILESNHFTVDIDQTKRINVMEEKIDQVKGKLNKVIKENIELKGQIEEYKKSLKFKKLTEGLSKVKVEKVLSLVEGLSFKDMDDFEKKVKLCIERVADKIQKQPLEEKRENLTESKKESRSSEVDKYLNL